MAPAHEDSGKASSRAKEHHVGGRERSRAVEEMTELVFTVNAKTAGVVKVEKIDSHGKRVEIANEQLIALASANGIHDIEMTLDEAFEAGITSVLEPGSDDEISSMSDEEVKLRHELLIGLIGSGVRHRLQRRLVQRLIFSKAWSH